jgi:hypothetical protein
MPKLISSVQGDFEKYYKIRHAGKQLTFAPQMSTALVFANFAPKADGSFA